MKQVWSIFLIFLCTGVGCVYAQSAELSMQNIQLNGDEISFEVYLRSTTTSTIYFAQASLYFSFDASKFTDLTASFSSDIFADNVLYSAVTTLYDDTPERMAVDIAPLDLLSTTNVVAISDVGDGTKIGTITLSGLTNFTDDIDLQWYTLSPFTTMVYQWDPETSLQIPLPISLATPTGDGLSDPVAVNLKVLLEGAHTTGGLMNTVLYAQNLIPTTDPYKQGITLSGIPANVVDWVSLEFRSATDNTVRIADTVGFLMNNGVIAALDGKSQILMNPNSIPPGRYYVIVRHRNHAAIMSSIPIVLSQNNSEQYDFTTSQNQVFTTGSSSMVQVASNPDIFAMVAEGVHQDGIVNAIDRVDVYNSVGLAGYLSEDLNMDGNVDATDRTIVTRNTFRTVDIP